MTERKVLIFVTHYITHKHHIEIMVLLLLLILAGPNHIGPALMMSTEENFPNSSSCLCSNLKIQLERDCMKVSKRTQ